MLQEALGGQDDHLAGGQLFLQRQGRVGRVLPVDQAQDAAVVIHMGVAVQHGLDVQLAEVLLHQGLGGGHILPAHQHVKHDPAAVRADEGGVGHVVAPHLVDAVADLEQTRVLVIQRVAPQAGVHGVRRGLQLVNEAVVGHIPDLVALVIVDDQRLRRLDESP